MNKCESIEISKQCRDLKKLPEEVPFTDVIHRKALHETPETKCFFALYHNVFINATVFHAQTDRIFCPQNNVHLLPHLER
jgi:hypothetical protein